MLQILKRLNTAITVITTVYTVSKFMYKTFQKYEEKHGKGKNIKKTCVEEIKRDKETEMSGNVQDV